MVIAQNIYLLLSIKMGMMDVMIGSDGTGVVGTIISTMVASAPLGQG